MTVVPHLLPDPLEACDPRPVLRELEDCGPGRVGSDAAWLPGLTSVTRLVGTAPAGEPVLSLVPRLAEGTEGPDRTLPRAVPAASPRRTVALGDLRLVEDGPEETASWAKLFCQTVIEVMAGDRNPQQLIRRMDAEVYDALVARRSELQRVTGRRRRHPVRAQVRSVRISQPAPLIAEVAARIEHGQRSRAMAVRLELVDGRWVCTALELG